MSTTSTDWLARVNAAARLITVTVLPTPPFSFATAMVLVFFLAILSPFR